MLLDAGEPDDASDMADRIAKFLDNFGLRRELDEMRQWVEKVVAAINTQNDGELTRAEC